LQHRISALHFPAPLGPDAGYLPHGGTPKAATGRVCICPNCDNPTYFNEKGEQFPGVTMGDAVTGIIDPEVESMYLEARRCSSVGAYTACVMACRKLLMNVAVHKKAPENQTFAQYVEFLDAQGYIPPDGRAWVDEIRKRGNLATHEIKLMSSEDASVVLDFTAMLLRFVYELPSKLPKPKS
jgi:hypothetical protein